MRVSVVNLGCKVNRVESDQFIVELEDLGHHIVQEEDAQAIILNTCSVTQEADKKTRKSVRHLASLPAHPKVYVTGCSAMLHKEELEALADNVEVYLFKQEIVSYITSQATEEDDDFDEDAYQSPSISKEDLGTRRLGLKIQDGCDNRCTYCIIWKARGKAVSYKPDLILERVNKAVGAGAEEMVLTGINLGSYSYEYEGKTLNLSSLIKLILDKTDIKRLRLSSIEPLDVTDELIDTIKTHSHRICQHLHMSLQSGSEKTLKEMARIYTARQFREIVLKLKEKLPDMALSTDVIVGFPGESDEDFLESFNFCKEMGFSKIHVFRYSKRQGTIAAARKDQVPSQVISERAKRMRELSDEMRLEDAERRLGSKEAVIIEHKGQGTSESYHKVKVSNLDESVQVGDLVLAQFDSINEQGQIIAHYLGPAYSL